MIHGFLSAVVHKQGQAPKQLAFMNHNLLVDSGRDTFHNLVYTNPSGTYRGFGCIGVTENTAQTINAAQTALTGEISTNGLARADATTKTHSAGTNSTTIEHTFTASGAFTDVVRSATFNATSSGTMAHFAAFSSGSGTLASSDTLKVTWTLNLG